MRNWVLIIGVLLTCIKGYSQNHTDENGLKQGPWSKKYPWGALRYEGAFEDDKEIGAFRFYDQNGKIVSQRVYETPGGISNAIIYMPNGKVEAIGQFDGKKKIGTWKYFSTRGYLVSTDEFVDGLRHGPEYIYYSDSTVAELIHWANNEKNGEWIKKTVDGKTELKANYVNGQLHGAYLKKYPNGKKQVEGVYKKGLKHGKWFYYSERGIQDKMEIYEFGDIIKTVTREENELKTKEHR